MDCQIQNDFHPRQCGSVSTKKPSLKARSLNGCWTCRVRRKKCDESPLSCRNCSDLSLNCDGYGSRPAWFDSGSLEKAKALKIKNIVKQTIKRRARGLSGSASSRKESCSQTPHPVPSSFSSTSLLYDGQFVQGGIIYSPNTEQCSFTSWDYPSYLMPGSNYDTYGAEESTVEFTTMGCAPTAKAQDEQPQEGLPSDHLPAHHVLPALESVLFNMQTLTEPSVGLEADTGMDSLQETGDPYFGSALYHVNRTDEEDVSTPMKDTKNQSTSTMNDQSLGLIMLRSSGDTGSHEATLLMHILIKFSISIFLSTLHQHEATVVDGC